MRKQRMYTNRAFIIPLTIFIINHVAHIRYRFVKRNNNHIVWQIVSIDSKYAKYFR